MIVPIQMEDHRNGLRKVNTFLKLIASVIRISPALAAAVAVL